MTFLPGSGSLPIPLTIQQLLDSVNSLGRIQLPLGVNSVGSLTTNNLTGSRVQGHGAPGDLLGVNNVYLGAQTQILRDNETADSEPLLILEGSHHHWSDITFVGDNNASSQGSRPDVGIQIVANALTTPASGRNLFDNHTIHGMKTAIQAGEVVGDSNCDLSIFRKGRYTNNDTVFKCVNTQGMGNRFYDPHIEFAHSVQSVAITGSPTGGTYTLTYTDPDPEPGDPAEYTTSPLAYNADAETIRLAIRNLPPEKVELWVETSGSAPNITHRITFNVRVALLTSANSMTGGTPAITHTEQIFDPVADADPEANPLINNEAKVFHFLGGGKFLVDSPHVSSACTLLTIDSTGGGIGGNNGYYEVRNSTSDSQAGPGYRMLHVTDNNDNIPMDIRFLGGITSNDFYDAANARQILLEGSCFVLIDGYMGLQKGSIEWHTEGQTSPTVVVVKNCRCGNSTTTTEVTAGTDLLKASRSTGDIEFIFENTNRDFDNGALAAINSTVGGEL